MEVLLILGRDISRQRGRSIDLHGVKDLISQLHIPLSASLVTRTYVKLYGPNVTLAIRALERVSLEVPGVRIMSAPIWQDIAARVTGGLRDSPVGFFALMAEIAMSHFAASGVALPKERSRNLLSRSGENLREYDFFFEWAKKPKLELVYRLIERIDEEISETGCRYTLTTKQQRRK